jgi:hypothetical protein
MVDLGLLVSTDDNSVLYRLIFAAVRYVNNICLCVLSYLVVKYGSSVVSWWRLLPLWLLPLCPLLPDGCLLLCHLLSNCYLSVEFVSSVIWGLLLCLLLSDCYLTVDFVSSVIWLLLSCHVAFVFLTVYISWISIFRLVTFTFVLNFS